MSLLRRRVAAVLLATLIVSGGLAATPAQACIPGQVCDSGGVGGGGGGSKDVSDGTTSTRYNTSQRTCSVYANGASMGSYCVVPGGATTKTLRERFGKQKLQMCRYSAIPDGIPTPFNSRPEEGRYMLMTCLDGIDFDTYAGGNDRTFNISIVFVPNGTDIENVHNGITDFLWNQIDKIAKMPVPFMVTRPNVTPLVGIPTYFTFKWVDPTSPDKDVVAEGPYAGRANGGPFIQVRSRGLIMRAEAESVRVDPNQKDIKAVRCAPDTPYKEGAKPAEQPADACSITFPRSSASARKYATDSIPSGVDDAFYATIEVRWRVTYGEDEDNLQELGNGFTMRLHQVLPVQEVQTPNQPPTVIY